MMRPIYRCPLAALAGLAFSLCAGEQSYGQTVQADQAALARSQPGSAYAADAAGLVGDHAVPSPNDSDLGEQAILKRSERYQPLSISVGLPFYWTSNVALVRSGEQSDFLLAPVVALAYTPRLSNQLYGLFSIREQMFYYDRNPSLDFGDLNIETGVAYSLPQWHNLVLRGEFICDRLTQRNSLAAIFSNYSFFFSAELPFRFGRAQQLSIGTDANISVAGFPEPPRRNDYEVYAGYSVNVTRCFSLDAVGRIILHTYQLTNRVDVSEVLATSGTFSFSKYFSASAISTLAANQSNHGIFDYKVANVGGLVSLNVKF